MAVVWIWCYSWGQHLLGYSHCFKYNACHTSLRKIDEACVLIVVWTTSVRLVPLLQVQRPSCFAQGIDEACVLIVVWTTSARLAPLLQVQHLPCFAALTYRYCCHAHTEIQSETRPSASYPALCVRAGLMCTSLFSPLPIPSSPLPSTLATFPVSLS